LHGAERYLQRCGRFVVRQTTPQDQHDHLLLLFGERRNGHEGVSQPAFRYSTSHSLIFCRRSDGQARKPIQDGPVSALTTPVVAHDVVRDAEEPGEATTILFRWHAGSMPPRFQEGDAREIFSQGQVAHSTGTERIDSLSVLVEKLAELVLWRLNPRS
jgi:hypothetical protein